MSLGKKNQNNRYEHFNSQTFLHPGVFYGVRKIDRMTDREAKPAHGTANSIQPMLPRYGKQ